MKILLYYERKHHVTVTIQKVPTKIQPISSLINNGARQYSHLEVMLKIRRLKAAKLECKLQWRTAINRKFFVVGSIAFYVTIDQA